MVVGRDFAWGHMGKTGGDATYALFQCVPDLVVRAHRPEDPDKHRNFAKEGVEDKKLVLNLRRLPSLMLSHVHHAKNYGLKPDFPKGTEVTPEQAVAFDRPERMIRNFLDDGRLKIHRWLRMEHLRDDFLAWIATIRPLTEGQIRRIRTVPTKPPMSYDHDPAKFFSPPQIEALYRNNPTWARHELEVYGEVPVSIPAG